MIFKRIDHKNCVKQFIIVIEYKIKNMKYKYLTVLINIYFGFNLIDVKIVK